jgi:hypothetical protein
MARIEDHEVQTFYHGTSLRSWKTAIRGDGKLYLVTDPRDAWEYAYEQAARDEGEGGEAKPVVFYLTAPDIVGAFDVGLRFGPDDGAYGYKSGMPWAVTLREYGSVTLNGPAAKIKKLPWKKARKPVEENHGR